MAKQKREVRIPLIDSLTIESYRATVAGPRLSDEAAQQSARFLKALADPARLQILDMLLQQADQICVCAFEGVVGLPDPQTQQRPRQPTISHHLRVLREAGIVDFKKQGLWAYYFIRPEQLERVRTMLALVWKG
jgi:ArsR family transcriptional regulator